MDSPATIVAFLAYCLIQGITPGPANTCSFAMSIRYGTRPALRQWVGLLTGFLIVSAASMAVVWFAGASFEPALDAISIAGAAYLTWLAWHMLAHRDEHDRHTFGKPTFISGVVLQATNAKIAAGCIAAFGSFIVPTSPSLAAIIAATIAMPLVGASCNLIWLWGGTALRGFYLEHSKAVDALMAAALILCALAMLPPLTMSAPSGMP